MTMCPPEFRRQMHFFLSISRFSKSSIAVNVSWSWSSSGGSIFRLFKKHFCPFIFPLFYCTWIEVEWRSFSSVSTIKFDKTKENISLRRQHNFVLPYRWFVFRVSCFRCNLYLGILVQTCCVVNSWLVSVIYSYVVSINRIKITLKFFFFFFSKKKEIIQNT